MAVKKNELYSSLWASCDKLRGGMDASQYKDVILGLVFLKYVSDAFDERREQISADLAAEGYREDQIDGLLNDIDEYTGNGVFWIPTNARWSYLAQHAKGRSAAMGQPFQPIGELIDDEQPAPALLIGPVRRPRIRRGYQPAPVAVAHLDPDAAVPHAAGHLDVRARVDQRVRHDFAGEQGDVGGGVRCLPVLERVPDEPPGRRGRRGIGREGCAGMTRDRHETSGVYF